MGFEALSDVAILKELGIHLKKKRIEKNLSQEDVAKQSGVSRRSIVSIENGKGGRLLTLIEILRAIEHLEFLDNIFQDSEINPMDLLRQQRKIRKNVFKKRK